MDRVDKGAQRRRIIDAKQKCNKNVTIMFMQILVLMVSNNIFKDASHYGVNSEKMKFWFRQQMLMLYHCFVIYFNIYNISV